MRKLFEPPQPKVWVYECGDGWQVLAGKTDEDNDILSLQVARAHELWFHVHSVPGSHVILRAPEGTDDYQPTREKIEAAAAVAAYHSKARNAGTTPVDYCEACHVSKERGAVPGLVMIRQSKTIKVRPMLPGRMERP